MTHGRRSAESIAPRRQMRFAFVQLAAYAQHESRYSPSNITGSWSDPSESGQAGQSGGILS